MSEPSPNGSTNGDGRDERGRFAPGNKGGPGNPGAVTAARRRTEFWALIKSEDIALAVETIRNVMADKTARPGERLAAARELLNRVVGDPAMSELLDRVAALEQLLESPSH
jgi:hypothetical protein